MGTRAPSAKALGMQTQKVPTPSGGPSHAPLARIVGTFGPSGLARHGHYRTDSLVQKLNLISSPAETPTLTSSWEVWGPSPRSHRAPFKKHPEQLAG